MREQASVIQDMVGDLLVDVGRLGIRVDNLDKHFDAAVKDVNQIKISAGKIQDRGARIESLELDEPDEVGSGGQGALPLT